MQIYAIYWPEGGVASQKSVFIGHMQLTGQSENQVCAKTETSKFG